MPTQNRILHVFLVTIIAFSFYLIPAHASPIEQVSGDSPSSNSAPEGYVPQISEPQRLSVDAAAGGGSSDILLVQTALPWNSDANTQVLSALGYAYDIVDMSNISQVDLFRYPVILIVNDQVQAFYDQYAAQVAAFENYVENGGTLVFFASSDGWAEGTLQANLPGGVSITTPWYEYNNFISNANHPIVSGQLSEGVSLVDSDLYSTYCSHGYFSNLPDNADVVLRESHGYPTLIDYKLGSGRVIASTLTWEHNWKYYYAFAQKSLDDVFLYAFSSGSVVDGIIRVAPGNVPADGVSTATVTLTDATPGQRVRLTSSRDNVDHFANASGVVDAQGRFVTTIRSSTSGTSILTAWDAVTGQRFPATAKVTFTPVNGSPTPIPPNVGPIAITEINPEHPLDARYLEGIPVANRVQVVVDWKGSTPDYIKFDLNGKVITETARTDGASHVFDMGSELRWGNNSLVITAYNVAGEASQSLSFVPFSTPMPVWMIGLREMGLASFPLLSSGDIGGKAGYELGFHLPREDFDVLAPGFGVPDGETKLSFGIEGKMNVPLFCQGPIESSLSASGEKGFSFLGTKLKGTLSGEISAQPIGLCVWDLPQGKAKLDVEASRNIYRKPVLVMIAYFNVSVGVVVEETIAFLHIEELIAKVLGEFYIDGKVHIGAEADSALLEQAPYFQLSNMIVAGGVGIEGGYREKIPTLELKVWAGADGTVSAKRQGVVDWTPFDKWTFDSITLKGEVGAEIRFTWFSRATKGEITWTYPPTLQAAMPIENIVVSDWSLIHHPNPAGYEIAQIETANQTLTTFLSGVKAAGIAEQTTITSTLITNIYTYSEPSLAINPTSNALLLWTHDNINKPVGQSHEIRYSLWNGTVWSTPADITNDNLLDGAPQINWAGNGQGIAVWQRLTSSLPATATLDAATMQKVEIATSSYNPTTKSWTPISLLTSNNALDMAPLLARNPNGGLLAVWRQNQSGQVGGDATHPDQIMAAFYNNSWGSAQAAVGNVAGLFELAVAYGNNAATIAFSRYLTPTGSITPSLQLFTSGWNGSAWSAPFQLTDDSLGNSDPQVAYNAANQPLLVWLVGKELRLRNLTTNQITRLTLPEPIGTVDEFQLVQDAKNNLIVVFTAQGNQNRDLYLALYDQAHNQWGLPRQLTNDSATESYPSPVLDSNGRLFVSYTSTALNSVTKTTVSPTTGEAITFTMPTEGQTDLMTLVHAFSNNLTLASGDLVASNLSPMPGETVNISATVRNSGDFAINPVTLTFYDGDPNIDGTQIGAQRLPGALSAGMSATVTISYLTPLQLAPRALIVIGDAANQIAESNEGDNRAEIAIYSPDLALQELGIHYWGGSDVDLISQIANLGSTASLTTTIAYYQQTVTGTLLVTDVVPAIEAGQAFTLTTPWNYGSLSNGSYQLVAAVNASGTDFGEVTFENNVASVVLEVAPDLMVNSYYLHSTPLTEGSVAFTATIYNVGSQAITNASIAFYKRGDLANGSLLATKMIGQLDSGSTTEISGEAAGPIGCGLYVVADPNHQIDELSRANNVAYLGAENGRCASFNNAPFYAIAPATIVFSNTSTGDNTSWLWNFGDGTTSTEQSPSHQYLNRGAYTVTLTATGNDGVDTIAVPNAVRIYQPAVAGFAANPTSGFAPLDVQFTDQSTGDISAWQWDFGDGSTSDARNAVHTYEQKGTYAVTLTVSGAGGSNTIARTNYIVVNQPPTATPTPTNTPTLTPTKTPTPTFTPTATSVPVTTLKGIGTLVAAPGSNFIFNGSGFAANQQLTVYLALGSTEVVNAALKPIGTVKADSSGSFVLTINTSADVKSGEYTIAVGDSPRASAKFAIDASASLQLPTPQGTLIQLSVEFNERKIYLPVVSR